MRPIAPPPRKPRSRIHRDNAAARVSEPSINYRQRSVSVDQWLPFEDNLRSSSSGDSVDIFIHKFDDEMAISTSCSGEDSDERGNIEVQLNNTVGNYEEWGSTSIGRGFLGVAPIPLPSIANQNYRPAEDLSSESVLSSLAAPLSANIKIVQRKGLFKRNEDLSTTEETKKSRRGRRGKSVGSRRQTRDASRVRSSSLMTNTFATKRKSKTDKPPKRSRSRSIVRVEPRSQPSRPIQDIPEVIENGSAVEERRGRNQQELPVQIDTRVIDVPFDEVLAVDLITPVAESGAGHSNICLPSPIHIRNLLATSVYNNEATGIWITTINMSQKEAVNKSNAAKYLKAFSFQTEREARESGKF
jgi:hypothetical protein